AHVLRVAAQKLVEQAEAFRRNTAGEGGLARPVGQDVIAAGILRLEDAPSAAKLVFRDHVGGGVLQQDAGLAVVDTSVADDEIALRLFPPGRDAVLPADMHAGFAIALQVVVEYQVVRVARVAEPPDAVATVPAEGVVADDAAFDLHAVVQAKI